jgi:hypothetical protein
MLSLTRFRFLAGRYHSQKKLIYYFVSMKMSKRKTEIISKSCNSVTTYSNCREQKVER